MTWPVAALFSLDELKRYVPGIAASSEELLTDIAGWVLNDVERYLERRLVYRAPTEDDDLIYTGSFTAGNPVPLAQPAAPGRTLVVAFPAGATAGTLTVAGTVAGVATTRAFDVANGLTQHGLDFFTTVSGLTIAGAAPASGTLKVGTSLGYVEYHSPRGDESHLRLIERPAYQVAAVYEDATRVYATALATTAYGLPERRRLARFSSGYLSIWLAGYRSVKVVYSAGYSFAALPHGVKRVALRLASLYYTESVKGQIEVASGSNALGSWSRSGPATLGKEMRQDIESERNFRGLSAERDFDLEAA